VTEPRAAKPVRECTACSTPLTLEQIVYSSDYPDQVRTRAGTLRKGTLKDAARVWCGAECAKQTYVSR